MSNTQAPSEAQPKPKRNWKKMMLLTLAFLAIAGGGGAGLYASGLVPIGGGSSSEPVADLPQLVVREGVSSAAATNASAKASSGRPDPRVFQPTYHPLEGNFTSNLGGGDAFVQVGLGVSTFYDERVIQNLQTHDMAIRSAVLMTLSEADPAALARVQGKEALKSRLRNAVNGVLTNKEGFGGIDDVYFTSFVTQ